MNPQQSLALARVRLYKGRPEVETVCDAAEAWFTLQDLLAAKGWKDPTPQMIADWQTLAAWRVGDYAASESFVILREPVRLDEDPPDGDEDA